MPDPREVATREPRRGFNRVSALIRRRVIVGVLVVVVAAGALAVARARDARDTSASAAAMQRLLGEHLARERLSYRYVACIDNGRRFAGQPVIRCNVNFGAPHIEVYCAVVRDGRALTNHEDAAIPCPRDDAGQDPPVREY